jgi:hypothetical protein
MPLKIEAQVAIAAAVYLLEDTENTRWLKVRKKRKLMSSLSPPLDCAD